MSWLENKIESVDDPGAPTTPTRALDTAFQPNVDKNVLAMYSIELECGEGQSSLVELRSDAANPPTTVRVAAKLIIANDSDAATTTTKTTVRQQLTYVVPPGHYVKLVKTATGLATLSNQTEIILT